VPEVLKVLELTKDHGVAEMNVRGRWVHAEIHAQRLSSLGRLLELRGQIFLTDDFGDAFFEIGDLFGDGFEFAFGHFESSLGAAHRALSALCYAQILSGILDRAPSSNGPE